MRPPKRWALLVGAVIGVGFLVVEMQQSASTGDVALASERSSDASAVCSLATLHGTYTFAADGVQIAEPGAGPFAYAGQITYDGKGGVTEVYSASFNGSISRTVRETGTYTVNRDCTESEVDSGGGSTQHYDSFVHPDGSQFAFVQTDAGVVSAGTAIRTATRSKAD